MGVTLSFLQKFDHAEVKNVFKVEKDKLSKYFHIKNQNHPLLVKWHRLIHWMFHGIWINEKKLKKLSSRDTPTPIFSRTYGERNVHLFPNFQKFIRKPPLSVPFHVNLRRNTKRVFPQLPKLKFINTLQPDEIRAIESGAILSPLSIQKYLLMAIHEGKVKLVHRLIEQPHLSLDFMIDFQSPLLIAIQSFHPEIALLLLERQASPDFFEKGLGSPLELAVALNFPEVASKLLDLGAEVGRRDLYAVAISYKSYDTLRLLLKLGIEVCKNPIHYALHVEDVEALGILLPHQFNPDIPDHELYKYLLGVSDTRLFALMLNYGLQFPIEDLDFRIMVYSYASQEIMEFLLLNKYVEAEPYRMRGAYNYCNVYRGKAHLKAFYRMGVRPFLYEEWLRQKFLAHRFDIKEKGKFDNERVKLSSFNAFFTVPEAYLSLKEFFVEDALEEFPEFTAKARINILEAFLRFDPWINVKGYLSAYCEGKLVLIPSESAGHTYYRVFYKEVMLESNRGDKFEESILPGMQMYSIRKPGRKELEMSMKQKKTLEEDSTTRLRIHEDLFAKKIVSFQYKPHKTGICAWAGLKTAIRGMFFLVIFEELQKSMSTELATYKAEEMMDKIYKKWSLYDLEFALKRALDHYKKHPEMTLNRPLLLKIKQKFRGSRVLREELQTAINRPMFD